MSGIGVPRLTIDDAVFELPDFIIYANSTDTEMDEGWFDFDMQFEHAFFFTQNTIDLSYLNQLSNGSGGIGSGTNAPKKEEWKPTKENCASLFADNPGLNIKEGDSHTNLVDTLLSSMINAGAMTESLYFDFSYRGESAQVRWEHYSHIFVNNETHAFSYSIGRAPGPLGADPGNPGGTFNISVPRDSEPLGLGHSHSVGSWTYSRVTNMVRGFKASVDQYYDAVSIISDGDAASAMQNGFIGVHYQDRDGNHHFGVAGQGQNPTEGDQYQGIHSRYDQTTHNRAVECRKAGL